MPTAMRTPLLALALAACASSTPGADDPEPAPERATTDPQPAATPPVTPAAAPKPVALGELAIAKLPTTDDGIPILTVARTSAAKSGEVVWIPKDALALDSLPQMEASDGATSYLVVDDDSSILVRGSEVHEGILRRYGIEKDGCGGMRGGEIVLSGIVTSDRDENVVSIDAAGKRTQTTRKKQVQITVSIDRAGNETIRELPPTIGTEARCHVWVGNGGEFMLAASSFVHFDGKAFAKLDGTGLGWYPGRTTVGAVRGRRFCFTSCNATEEADTDPLTHELRRAIDAQRAEWTALDEWVAGATGSKAVRVGKDGKIATVEGIPSSSMLNGSVDVALTGSGDLVIGLAYRFREYVVWRAGARTLSPVRKLDVGEVIAKSSPTVLVRGLNNPIPESKTYAVLLGKSIGVGVGGSTYGYRGLESSAAAHAARFARAKAVLGKGTFVGAHEAVVDLACGAFVRSPLGWEEVQVHDWIPPKLPALHAKAVTKPATCRPLATVSALPGDPDLLLAIHEGQLFAAWLPPPLPLPAGENPLREPGPRTTPAKPVVQRPRPGLAWFAVGPADRVHGDDGLPDPGGDTAIAGGSWQAGGGAIVEVDGTQILVVPEGAVTLPPGTTPMAVGTAGKLQVWGAQGDKLVECTTACRVLDPGVGFSKRTEDSVAVLAELQRLIALGHPVLVGVSRKRFIGELSGGLPVEERLAGTLGAVVASFALGAQIFRVHDVAAARRALDVANAILNPA